MLVRNINTIKGYIPVSASLDFPRIEPILPEAEQRIVQGIGIEMYEVLDAYITSSEGTGHVVNMFYDKAIQLLQSSIAWTLFDVGFDILNTHFSNQGFHRIENEQGKKPLFQRQELSLRATFRSGGANRLDHALTYMALNSAEFLAWVGSSAYTGMRDNFIWTTSQFQAIININASRLVFQRLRQTMHLVADLHIRPVIGSALHEEVLNQIAVNNISAANMALLPYLQKALAHRTMFYGNTELLTQLDETGINILSWASNQNNFEKKDQPREELIASYLRRAEMNSKSYISGVESFLKANIDTYPLYKNSEAYDAAGVFSPYKNDGKIFLT